MVKKFIRKTVKLIMFFPRKTYYHKRKQGLINTTPTIISNNCFGGLVYHNLGLEFRSPTINLGFSDEDFLLFLKDLNGYLNAELVESKEFDEEYPIGQLEYNGVPVYLEFMHYKTFEQAKEKWEKRKKRIDFSNLFIIFQTIELSEKSIHEFEELPFDNKMLILKNNPTNSKIVHTHAVLSKVGYVPGEILAYKSRFSLQRHMDDIDYITFLNTPILERRIGCQGNQIRY